MGSEQRVSFRCQVPEDEAAAVLNCLDTPLNARLINESSGGFLVAVDPAAVVCVGDSALLKTSAGSFTVRVMHTREEARETHVGLQRTSDLAASPPTPSTRSWWHRSASFRAHVSSSPVVLAAIVLLLLATATLFGAGWLSASRLLALVRAGDAAANDGGGQAADAESSTGSAGRGASSAATEGPHLTDDDAVGQMMREAVRRMDRTKGLLNPATSGVIGLTAEQRTAIQDILDDTGKRLWKSMANSARATAATRSKDCIAILDQMDRRVDQTLTDAQRSAWTASTADSNGEPSATPTPTDQTPTTATPSAPVPASGPPAAQT